MEPKYKRMIEGMARKERMRARPSKRRKNSGKKSDRWHLYVLRCGDGSLYTGIAKDLDRRIRQHSAGRGARYTRTHLPVEMVYGEVCRGRAHALVRECEVKAMPRRKKEELILNKRIRTRTGVKKRPFRRGPDFEKM